jgi:PAS domain-containing protein
MAEHSSGDHLDLSDISRALRESNQRYLDYLKASGDSLEFGSKVLATVMDSVADGVIVFDDNLTCVLANLSAGGVFGLEPEKMTREDMHLRYQFFLDEGKTPLPISDEPAEVARREKRSCEVVAFCVSPHLPPPGRWVRAHAAPVLDKRGAVIGVVTVTIDITEKLRLQKQRD